MKITTTLPAAFVMLASLPVLANPIVDGNTISWPDDGWYQVQSSDTFSTLCEGGTDCVVDNGTYTVINHSTGQRFNDIQVNASTVSSDTSPSQTINGIEVDGNTIRWPDDGWYQVQSVPGYATICEGGTECTVEAGTYNVINLTSDTRTTNLVVGQTGSSGSTTSSVVVSNNTISWPDDGWYQVQSASDFSTVCEGGNSCSVADGTYVVINHSNGQRFNDIVVGAAFADDSSITDSDDSITDIITNGVNPTQSLEQNIFPARVNFSTNDQGLLQALPVFSLAGQTFITRQLGDMDGDNLPELQFLNAWSENPNCEALTILPSTQTTANNVTSADIAASLQVISTRGDQSSLAEPCNSLAPAIMLGDINGDGMEDFATQITGIVADTEFYAVIFGTSQAGTIDVATLNGNNGFILNQTEPQDRFDPDHLRPVGDINGDGYDDFSFLTSGSSVLVKTGSVQMIFPGASSFPALLNAQEISASQTLVLAPADGRERLVRAGDINGDGFADLMTENRVGAQPAILYGYTNILINVDSTARLPMDRFIDYCATGSCIWRVAGDFDADGFDDMVLSRFSCGFGYYVRVLYGNSGGIVPRASILDYPLSERTRIVEEAGSECHSGREFGTTSHDINNDGTNDLLMNSRTGRLSNNAAAIFGTPGKRLDSLSTSDMDGTNGLRFAQGLHEYSISDVDRDGIDDLVSGDSFLPGRTYRPDNAGPTNIVVQQGEGSLTAYWQAPETGTAESYRISINDSFITDTSASITQATFTDPTNGSEATMVIEALSASGVVLGSNQRNIPARVQLENLVATVQAPRLVQLEFNASSSILRYSRYLVWRDGEPLIRAEDGANSYWDASVEPGRTYTYHITPDYLLGESLDASRLQTSPLLQRQSNTVTVTMPQL